MKKLIPRFMETIPKEIDEGILYISMNYHTASHKCACGCGRRVVTPLSPAGWILIFDGKTVSLEPSIGNWSTCKSHYWITKDEIEWAPQWSKERITRGLLNDQKALREYFLSKGNDDNTKIGVVKDRSKKPQRNEDIGKKKLKLKEKKRKRKGKK